MVIVFFLHMSIKRTARVSYTYIYTRLYGVDHFLCVVQTLHLAHLFGFLEHAQRGRTRAARVTDHWLLLGSTAPTLICTFVSFHEVETHKQSHLHKCYVFWNERRKRRKHCNGGLTDELLCKSIKRRRYRLDLQRKCHSCQLRTEGRGCMYQVARLLLNSSCM